MADAVKISLRVLKVEVRMPAGLRLGDYKHLFWFTVVFVLCPHRMESIG